MGFPLCSSLGNFLTKQKCDKTDQTTTISVPNLILKNPTYPTYSLRAIELNKNSQYANEMTSVIFIFHRLHRLLLYTGY